MTTAQTLPADPDLPDPDSMEPGHYELVKRLTKDMKTAARLIGRREARYLVDSYYQIQDYRMASGHQRRKAEEGGEPAKLLDWVSGALETLESDIKRALGEFARSYKTGEWLQSICGIGPVISAGLLANLDVPPPPTVGHWWSFAGLNPTKKWLGAEKTRKIVGEVVPVGHRGDVGNTDLQRIVELVNRESVDPWLVQPDLPPPQPWLLTSLISKLDGLGSHGRAKVVEVLSKRPWSASLKVLMYKAGECFVKVQGNKKDFYGALYKERKNYEARKNSAGDYRDQAAAGALRVGNDTEAYKSYAEGRLPAGHLHSRARRWTVKLFLSHIHHMFWLDFFGTPVPKPFPIDRLAGHVHWVGPPNLEVYHASQGKKLAEMVGGPTPATN